MKKENNTSFMKNLAMLMISQFVIKIMGFIYRVVMMNIEGFGDIGKGFYNAGYQIYAILLTISSVGIPTVISKLVAERVGRGDNRGAYRIFKTALILFAGVGLILSITLFFFAEQIATVVLNIPDVQYILMALAPAIVFVAISSVLRGYFAGLGSMKAASISQTLEQFLKCVLTITLVYSFIGNDPVIMAAAGNLATTFAILVSCSYLLVFYQRRKKGILTSVESQVSPAEHEKTWTVIKTILAISIPMTLGSLVSVINNAIDTITISHVVQNFYEGTNQELQLEAMRLTGMLAKVETIIHMPLAVTAAFCTALVPAISSLMAKKNMEEATKKLSFSFFAAILIIIPSAIGLAVISEPILRMLYPAAPEGAGILVLTTITMIFVALNYVINGGLFGLGKVIIPVISLVVGGMVKLILNIVLISNPDINVYGATIGSIVCQGIAFVICFTALNRHIKMKISFKNNIVKPVIAAGIMGIGVWYMQSFMYNFVGNAISTMIAIFTGIIIYVIVVLLTKCLSKEDIYMIPFGTKAYKVLVKVGLYN